MLAFHLQELPFDLLIQCLFLILRNILFLRFKFGPDIRFKMLVRIIIRDETSVCEFQRLRLVLVQADTVLWYVE